jgi:hypothetical protein
MLHSHEAQMGLDLRSHQYDLQAKQLSVSVAVVKVAPGGWFICIR